MRENELEQRRIEAARIITALQEQEKKLNNILDARKKNNENLELLFSDENLDIKQVENHRNYSLKLSIDEKNQLRIISNTKAILEKKQEEVREAHKKAETLKKLKEKQERDFYNEFWKSEGKEMDDITSARYSIV